jgi:hypothetical protein
MRILTYNKQEQSDGQDRRLQLVLLEYDIILIRNHLQVFISHSKQFWRSLFYHFTILKTSN